MSDLPEATNGGHFSLYFSLPTATGFPHSCYTSRSSHTCRTGAQLGCYPPLALGSRFSSQAPALPLCLPVSSLLQVLITFPLQCFLGHRLCPFWSINLPLIPGITPVPAFHTSPHLGKSSSAAPALPFQASPSLEALLLLLLPSWVSPAPACFSLASALHTPPWMPWSSILLDRKTSREK